MKRLRCAQSPGRWAGWRDTLCLLIFRCQTVLANFSRSAEFCWTGQKFDQRNLRLANEVEIWKWFCFGGLGAIQRLCRAGLRSYFLTYFLLGKVTNITVQV